MFTLTLKIPRIKKSTKNEIIDMEPVRTALYSLLNNKRIVNLIFTPKYIIITMKIVIISLNLLYNRSDSELKPYNLYFILGDISKFYIQTIRMDEIFFSSKLKNLCHDFEKSLIFKINCQTCSSLKSIHLFTIRKNISMPI